MQVYGLPPCDKGVGGRKSCSVGGENLLCLRNQLYRQEDIVIHEE